MRRPLCHVWRTPGDRHAQGGQQLIRVIAIKASIYNRWFSDGYGKVPQNLLVALSIEIFAAGSILRPCAGASGLI
jgi:hypothetical protein